MGFKFPTDCDKLKVPDFISDAMKGVFDAVESGAAFVNPMAQQIAGIASELTGEVDGLLGQIDQAVVDAVAAGDTAIAELLEGEDGTGGLLGSLGIGAGEGAGLLKQINDYETHSNILTGVGSKEGFMEVVGYATSYDGLTQMFGGGEGGFGDLFRSFEQAQDLFTDIQNRISIVKNIMSGGYQELLNPDNLATLLGSQSQLTNIASLVHEIQRIDETFLDKAKSLVTDYALTQLITQGNCYMEEMLKNINGMSGVTDNLKQATEEKVGPTLSEEEKIAVEQAKVEQIQENKSKGIANDNINELIATSKTSGTEQINAVKGRPVYREPQEVGYPISSDNNPITYGGPMWMDEQWIWWWGYSTLYSDSNNPHPKLTEFKTKDFWMDVMKEGDIITVGLMSWDADLEIWKKIKFNKDTRQAYSLPFGDDENRGRGLYRTYRQQIFGMVQQEKQRSYEISETGSLFVDEGYSGLIVNPEGEEIQAIIIEKPKNPFPDVYSEKEWSLSSLSNPLIKGQA